MCQFSSFSFYLLKTFAASASDNSALTGLSVFRVIALSALSWGIRELECFSSFPSFLITFFQFFKPSLMEVASEQPTEITKFLTHSLAFFRPLGYQRFLSVLEFLGRL